MDRARPRVLEAAPSLRLEDAAGRAVSLDTRDGEPVVVAFVDGCTLFERHEDGALPRALRAELRGLGAALVIVSDEGIWRFRPDDELLQCASKSDLAPGALPELRERFGAAGESLSLFVVDGSGMLRFARTVPSSGELAMSALVAALSSAGRVVTARQGGTVRVSRRELVVTTLIGAFALVLAEACRRRGVPSDASPPDAAPPVATSPYDLDVTLNVNGTPRVVRIDPRVSLLDALRERLGLLGTKKGCDHGQCGACTVLVDDRRVNACLTLAIMVQGKRITTIEGLATGDTLHPMQAAFADSDGFQCGYCTPGQIMSAVALLSEGHAHTDDEVREQMSGNICRCGAYPHIVSAIQLARKQVKT